jgi:intracellular multiplication protein IcmP
MADKKDTGYSLAIGWALLLFIIGIVGYYIWYYNQYDIMDTIRWVRYAELQVIALFVPDTAIVGIAPSNGQPFGMNALLEIVGTTPKMALTPAAIEFMSRVTTSYLQIPLSILFIAMAVWAMFYGPGNKHRRKYNIGSFIKTQAPAFPYIAPLVDFNPTEQPFRAPGSPVPADLPPFAEALSPEEWIAFCGIPTLTNREIDQGAATTAFAQQLGKPYKGWKFLAPERQVLLAAFALKASRKRDESDDMIGKLAVCWAKGRLSLSSSLLAQARRILRNEKLAGKILALCNQHAFETTAMLRALACAREEGGVLAPATFVWLRAHDRALWYPLNNLGRNAYHMEALGAMYHYKAEKLVKRPIVRPKVDGAVESLVNYMKSYRARPIPEVDYKGSKRRAIKKMQGGAA